MKRLLISGLLLSAVIFPTASVHAWQHCDTDHPESDCETTTTPQVTVPTTIPQTTTAPRGTVPTNETTTTTPTTTTVTTVPRGNLPVSSPPAGQLPNTGGTNPVLPIAGVGLVAVGSLAGLARRRTV